MSIERESCPCLHTTPCMENCTCVKPFSSYGCLRCATYGSKGQQELAAKIIVRQLDDGLRYGEVIKEIDKMIDEYRSTAQHMTNAAHANLALPIFAKIAILNALKIKISQIDITKIEVE